MRPGLYEVAIDCRRCPRASLRITGRIGRGGPIGYVERHSPEDALSYLDRRLRLPVALPSSLPEDTRLARRGVWINAYGGRGTAEIKLTFGHGGLLYLQYGRGSFDGCGGDTARRVSISGERGLLLANRRYPWSQVIWPVRRGATDGLYGLSGSVFPARALRLARSMQMDMSRTSVEDQGC